MSRLNHDPDFDTRPLSAKSLDLRRQPVITGVAFGADPNNSVARRCLLFDVLSSFVQFGQNNTAGAQQPLAGRSDPHLLAETLKQTNCEALFNPKQLMT